MMTINKSVPSGLLAQSEGTNLNTDLADHVDGLNCINSICSRPDENNTSFDAHVLPPHSNRGVDNTSGTKVSIDWCEFTLPGDSPSLALNLLKMDINSFIALEKGRHLYKNQLKCGNITILYNGFSPDMGVHVQMSGQGCREYEQRFGDDWIRLLCGVIKSGGHFSRGDGAADDFQGHFTVDMVRQKVLSSEVKTLFKDVDNLQKYALGKTTTLKGETLYFGSKKSDVMIRIYDKAKQQGVDYFWNRVEVQMRNERADSFFRQIAEGRRLGALMFGVLKQYLNFTERSADTNKARWAVSEWWSGFLGDVEKLRLTIEKARRSINDVARWVERQVAPSLALLKKAFGSSYGSFYQSMLFAGEERLKERHFLLLTGGT